MLQSFAKVAEKLAGDKPCIASIGYSLASDFMVKMDRHIVVNIKRTDRFLVRLLHTIDSEVQLAFLATYNQVVEAQSSSFRIDASIISTLCQEIKTIFEKVMRHQVADFNLPVDLENNATREILKKGDETESTLKKKRKRGEESSTRNFKQKHSIASKHIRRKGFIR